MKTIFFLLLCTVLTAGLFSQTILQGKVTDAETGAPIIFATVAIYKNNVLVTGTETDFDGFYSIVELDGGTCEVVFSYTGYQEYKVVDVVIQFGKANVLDVRMSAGITLDAVRVMYSIPLDSKDKTAQAKSMPSDDIRGLPIRNADALASLGAGASSKKEKKKTNAKDSRSDGANYYLDGIRIEGTENSQPAQPTDPVQELPEGYTEDYSAITENTFKSPKHEPVSTFSIDVDKASYGNVRRFLQRNQLPPRDAVRIEEMINYFDYDYPQPKDEHPFSVSTELVTSPWNEAGSLLLKIGLKGKEMAMKNAPPSNLVFLIDVSGSMSASNKLELVKPAMHLLVDQLRAQDRVAIVVYAGAAGLVLPSTPGNERDSILSAIQRLTSGGSTAGAAGIQLAYQVAKENFMENGNNRVILATDGDFNVGVSSDSDLLKLIEEKRKDGIFLTCLGFGMGNYKDNKLEILANKGNGNYAYIDNLMEAKKTFVTDLTGTLFTIAKDVKIQVEFNPKIVQAYRLIGYENRLLNMADFNDDTKDAGEIGAGHSVTVLYEIVPTESVFSFPGNMSDSLRYQSPTLTEAAYTSGELLTLKLRYKQPDGAKSRLMTYPVDHRWKAFVDGSKEMQWAASVAGFGMLLRDSEWKGSLTYDKVLEMALNAKGKDKHGYQSEALKLIETAGMLKRMEVSVEKK